MGASLQERNQSVATSCSGITVPALRDAYIAGLPGLSRGPRRRGDDGFCYRGVRWKDHAILSTLNLRNQDRMLILAVRVKLNSAKRRSREVDVLDGIANLGAVQRVRVVDGLRRHQQRCVGLHGMVLRVRVETLEVLGVKFF